MAGRVENGRVIFFSDHCPRPLEEKGHGVLIHEFPHPRPAGAVPARIKAFHFTGVRGEQTRRARAGQNLQVAGQGVEGIGIHHTRTGRCFQNFQNFLMPG